MVAAIIDKTVMNDRCQKPISLTCILNHERFTKTASKFYSPDNDYYGFFPQDKEEFRVKGLERFSEAQLEQLSIDCDLVYLTDTYGIVKSEWYVKKTQSRVRVLFMVD